MPLTGTALILRVPDIGETFAITESGWTHRYRVTGWMLRARRQSAIARDLGPNRVQLEWCARDAAEYVTGHGVAGTIQRIADVVIDGRVSWPASHIAEARDLALRLVGERLL